MIVFTTLDYLTRPGVPRQLTRRHGRDYQIVLVGPDTVEQARRRSPRSTRKRILATVATRHDIVVWLRSHDRPGIPWPKYIIEGM